jgi:hypothetical protein
MSEYNHPEAFCLMKYCCQECGCEEILWNSRDGVTPFCIPCRECGGDMFHIDWRSDERATEYIPVHGQRIFVDMPEELKAPIARQRMSSMDGTKFEKTGKSRKALLDELIHDFNIGEPWIIIWP